MPLKLEHRTLRRMDKKQEAPGSHIAEVNGQKFGRTTAGPSQCVLQQR